MNHITKNEPAVFRQLAIPLSIFDRIKQVQRREAAATGKQLTLNQTISSIVREHQKNEEREEHDQTERQRAPSLS